jgi:hypothetical protein
MLSADELARAIVFDNTDDQVMDLILAIDLRMGDLSFTERLYAALGDSIREELEADAEEPDRLAPVCMVPDCGCTGYAHA